MSEEALFKIIDDVMDERKEQGKYTVRQRIYDVMNAVETHRPGTSMSNGEIAKILGQLDAYVPRHSITRCLIELQDTGWIELVGRETRLGINKNQAVPVYRVVAGA